LDSWILEKYTGVLQYTHTQSMLPSGLMFSWTSLRLVQHLRRIRVFSDTLRYPPLRSKPGAGQWDIKPQEGKASGSGSRITHFTSQFLNSPCPRVRSR